MSERKLGFFVEIKAGDPAMAGLTAGIYRNISRIKFEANEDVGEKDSFRSGTVYEFNLNACSSKRNDWKPYEFNFSRHPGKYFTAYSHT